MKEGDFVCFLLLHLRRDADGLWSPKAFTPSSAGGRFSQTSSRAIKPDTLGSGALPLDGAFHPSVSSVHLNFSTAGVTPRFPSPPSIRQCSLLPACTHPQVLVSLGAPRLSPYDGCSSISKVQALCRARPQLAGAGTAWIICSTASTAEGPLAAY